MGSWISLLFMLVFWFVLSVTTGVMAVEMVILGVLVILVVKTLDRGLLGPEHFPQPRRWDTFFMFAFQAFIILLRDVVRANVQMAAVILNPRLPIAPRMFEHRTGLSTMAGRVALANSITLTPGTLTVRLDEDTLLVHALTQGAQDGLEDWELERLLLQLEES